MEGPFVPSGFVVPLARDGAIQARTTRAATQRLRLRGVVVVGRARPHDARLGDELLTRRSQPGGPARPASARRRLREQDGLHLHRPRSSDHRRDRLRVHAQARRAAVAGRDSLARGRMAVRACRLRRARGRRLTLPLRELSVALGDIPARGLTPGQWPQEVYSASPSRKVRVPRKASLACEEVAR